MPGRESNMTKIYLAPIDGRKSFYGKAVVTEDNGTATLRSYATDVAKIENGVFTRLVSDGNANSATTRRHIRAFCAHYGVTCPDLGRMNR